jgi:DnaJ homolog subfamily C member 19
MIKLVLFAAIAWFVWTAMKKPARPRVDEAEARAVLGVGPDADADEIRSAHRRLAVAVHPDRGGSADLTRRINAARDVLLKQRH